MKKMLLTLLAISLFLFVSSQNAWTGGAIKWVNGDGSVENPYRIETPENLAYLAQSVESGNSYSGKRFILMNDLVLNRYNFRVNDIGDLVMSNSHHFSYSLNRWQPIGSKDEKFKGIFDGNNKTISGMYLYYDDINIPKHEYQALFGYVTDTIKNLTLSNSYIGNSYDAPRLSVGGGVASIVSYMDNSALINCHTTNSVNILAKGAGILGGIVAQVTDLNNTSSLISNCTNRANIFVRIATSNMESFIGGIVGVSNGTVSGKPYGKCINYGNINIERVYGSAKVVNVGGIVGKLSANATSSIITECDNHGNILVNEGISNDNYVIGGIVGVNEGGEINVVYNDGSISEADGKIGGIVGLMKDKSIYSGRISNVTLENLNMKIYESGRGSNKAYGGVVGWLEGSSYIDNVTLKNSKIVASITTSDNAALELQIGGIVGRMDGQSLISRCVVKNDTIDIDAYVHKGTLKIEAGGMVGVVSNNNYNAIDKCYCDGFITFRTGEVNNSNKQIVAEIGALIGAIDNGIVRNSESNSIVEYLGSHVNLITSFGGIAGRNSGTIVNCFGCDSLSAVMTHIVRNVGGIAGANTGKIINCYHRGYYFGNVMSAGGIIGKNDNQGNKGTVSNSYYGFYNLGGNDVPIVDNNYRGNIQACGYFESNNGVLKQVGISTELQYGFNHLNALNSGVANLKSYEETYGKLLTWVEDYYNINEGYPVFDTSGVGTLPVELVSFTGKCVNCETSLFWTTATETNNDVFVVRKSTDGVNFTDIGNIQGFGTTSTPRNYKFVDNSCTSTLNYYSLAQIDFDGKTTVYDPIIVSCSTEEVKTASVVVVSPNPFVDNFSVELNIEIPGKFLVEVVDNQNKVVYTKTYDEIEADNVINVNMSEYPSGIYYLQIKTADKMFGEKLLKR